MKAIKVKSSPAGNDDDGEIIEIKTDCPECYREVETVRHMINDVSDKNVINVICGNCRKLLTITELI